MTTLADVTDEEFLHAQYTVAEEIKNRTQPIIDELRRMSLTEEGAPQQMDLMYIGLAQLLEPEIQNAKKEIETHHHRSIVGVFRYMGILTPKPIADKEALDYVLDHKLRGLHESSERLRVITQQRRELYENRVNMNALAREKSAEYLDKLEEARDVLHDTQEQIKAHDRECAIYKTQLADDYTGTTQQLLTASKKTRAILKKQERALDVELVKSEPLTKGHEQNVALKSVLLQSAERHYEHFHDQWCKTQYARDVFGEIVGSSDERTSLLTAYQTLHKASREAESAKKIVTYCDQFGKK